MSRVTDALAQGTGETVEIEGSVAGGYRLTVAATFATIDELMTAMGGPAPTQAAPRRSPRQKDAPPAAIAHPVEELRGDGQIAAFAVAEVEPSVEEIVAAAIAVEDEEDLAPTGYVEDPASFAPPAPVAPTETFVVCGAGPDPYGDESHCELQAGHRGFHRAVKASWEDVA